MISLAQDAEFDGRTCPRINECGHVARVLYSDQPEEQKEQSIQTMCAKCVERK